MWFRKTYHPHTIYSRQRKSKNSLIDQNFQLKYTLLFVLTAAICMILMSIPSLYFINQNYQIFTDLAYNVSPGLIDHLQKEQSIIQNIFLVTILGTIAIFVALGLKMTNRIIGPLKVLRNHIRCLCRGKWSQNPIQVREKDEFRDIINTYNYFYQSQQNQINSDIATLTSLQFELTKIESKNMIQGLISDKQKQLDIKSTAKVISLSENKKIAQNKRVS